MADNIDDIISRRGDKVVPLVLHLDGGEWAARLGDAFRQVLPASDWTHAIRQATGETVVDELAFAVGNSYSPSIDPLTVFRGAPGWYVYCGNWPGLDAIRSARKRADEHRLTFLAVLSVKHAEEFACFDELWKCSERGLIVLVDEQKSTTQNLSGAIETVLGAFLCHAWMKVPSANGNLSELFGLRQGSGVFTVGIGMDRPDLDCHASLWGKRLRAKIVHQMLSGEPVATSPVLLPAWPDTFASLLEPSSFSRGTAQSTNDIPEVRINWPQPGGGSILVCYHGRPVLRPVDDGNSIRAWLSKVRGLRELDSFLSVFGFEAANGFARLRAARDSLSFSSQIRDAARLPEHPKGLFAALKRNLNSWAQFGRAGSHGVLQGEGPLQALPAMIRRIEQQVMRQPSGVAVILKLGLILVAGLWLIFGPTLWSPATVLGVGSPAFIAGAGMLAGLVVLAALAFVWLWYSFRRTFWAYEQAVENIESRFLHRAMVAVLESLNIVARQVEQEAKVFTDGLEQVQVDLQEKMQDEAPNAVKQNANRRFPADAIMELYLEWEERLIEDSYARFRKDHKDDLLPANKHGFEWHNALIECATAASICHLQQLSYNEFSRVAGLSEGQQNTILCDVKRQAYDGLWHGVRDLNANPWILIPPEWRHLGEASNLSRVLTQSLPVVAAIGLIAMPRPELSPGEGAA